MSLQCWQDCCSGCSQGSRTSSTYWTFHVLSDGTHWPSCKRRRVVAVVQIVHHCELTLVSALTNSVLFIQQRIREEKLTSQPAARISFTDTWLQVNRRGVVSWLEPVSWTVWHTGRVKIKAGVDYQRSVSRQAQSLLTPTGSRPSSTWMITWLWRLERRSLAPSAWSQMSRTM